MTVEIAADGFTMVDIEQATDVNGGRSDVRRKVSKQSKLFAFSNGGSLRRKGTIIFVGGKTADRYSIDLHTMLIAFMLFRVPRIAEHVSKREPVRNHLARVGVTCVAQIGAAVIAGVCLKRIQYTDDTLEDLDQLLRIVFKITSCISERPTRMQL